MTRESASAVGSGMIFSNVDEAHRAYETGAASLHAKCKVRMDLGFNTGNGQGIDKREIIETTVGEPIYPNFCQKVYLFFGQQASG